jgi:hypothetical protein
LTSPCGLLSVLTVQNPALQGDKPRVKPLPTDVPEPLDSRDGAQSHGTLWDTTVSMPQGGQAGSGCASRAGCVLQLLVTCRVSREMERLKGKGTE